MKRNKLKKNIPPDAIETSEGVMEPKQGFFKNALLEKCKRMLGIED